MTNPAQPGLSSPPTARRTARSRGWQRAACWLALLAQPYFLAGCRDASLHEADAVDRLDGGRLSGRVIDENTRPIAGTALYWADMAAGEVREDGTFLLEFGPRNQLRQTLKVSAPGHSTIFRTYSPIAGTTFQVGDLVLRRASEPTVATLPAPGAPAVEVARTVGDGGITVLLEANKLVDADGGVVQGDVEVRLDYWHPDRALRTAPASLLARNGNDTMPLSCYGMAGIEVRQNGQALAVAEGERLTVRFKQSAARQTLWQRATPQLYALDEQDGLWVREGTVADGAVAYDPETTEATARLPHLSYWNLDDEIQPNNGGCVTGKAYSACDAGQPARNVDIRVWFLAYDAVLDWPTRTDNTGTYCAATPVTDWMVMDNDGPNGGFYVHYLVSGTEMSDTDMPNPLPSKCRVCDPVGINSEPLMRRCNDCSLFIPDEPMSVEGWSYHDTTPPPGLGRASLQGCSFCPGAAPTKNICTLMGSDGSWKNSGCAQLKPVTVKTQGCGCVSRGQPCNQTTKCCPADGKSGFCSAVTNRCDACRDAKPMFAACGSDSPCCSPLGEPVLECLDNICLPKSSIGGPT